MANLLKPSVDQLVFAHAPIAQPARGRAGGDYSVSFLGQDEPAEPISRMLVIRVVAMTAVRIALFAIAGHI